VRNQFKYNIKAVQMELRSM